MIILLEKLHELAYVSCRSLDQTLSAVILAGSVLVDGSAMLAA